KRLHSAPVAARTGLRYLHGALVVIQLPPRQPLTVGSVPSRVPGLRRHERRQVPGLERSALYTHGVVERNGAGVSVLATRKSEQPAGDTERVLVAARVEVLRQMLGQVQQAPVISSLRKHAVAPCVPVPAAIAHDLDDGPNEPLKGTARNYFLSRAVADETALLVFIVVAPDQKCRLRDNAPLDAPGESLEPIPEQRAASFRGIVPVYAYEIVRIHSTPSNRSQRSATGRPVASSTKERTTTRTRRAGVARGQSISIGIRPSPYKPLANCSPQSR